uniref:CASTOR/POLLUX/SYM8 ion channel conserved domain-containing protein n=1 Tax=Arundo donax TaxID=35708 RepID=A0A0A9DGL7_ARUDO
MHACMSTKQGSWKYFMTSLCGYTSDHLVVHIWEDILGFENCEFYIKRWPKLDGMRFEDVLINFPDAVPCGIKVASYGGKIILNPDDCYVLQEGDEVIVIAEDDDTYAPAPLPKVKEAFYIDIVHPQRKPQKILLFVDGDGM